MAHFGLAHSSARAQSCPHIATRVAHICALLELRCAGSAHRGRRESLSDVALGFPWISGYGMRHAPDKSQSATCIIHIIACSGSHAVRHAIPGKAQHTACNVHHATCTMQLAPCNVHHATHMQRTTSRYVTDSAAHGMQHAQTCTMQHAPHRIRQPRSFLWISGTLMGICVLLVNRHEPVSVDASSLAFPSYSAAAMGGRAYVRALPGHTAAARHSSKPW